MQGYKSWTDKVAHENDKNKNAKKREKTLRPNSPHKEPYLMPGVEL